MCDWALIPKPTTTLVLVEQAFWRVPLFTVQVPLRWSLQGHRDILPLGLFPLGLRVLDEFLSFCCMKEHGRIRLCNFSTLIDIVVKTAIVSFRTLPVGFSIANNLLDFSVHAVPWFLTTAFFSQFPFLAPKFLFRVFCSIHLFTIVFNLWSWCPAFFWWISRSYNSNTVLSFSDPRIVNLYSPSKISSGGIFVKDNKIPSHLEWNSWISFRRAKLNRSAYSRQNHGLQWPGSIRRSGKQSVFLEGNGPASRPLLVLPNWPFFWIRYYGWFCSVLKQSSHRVFQNLALELFLETAKIFQSSAESTISTSLIQSTASAGICEQVHTSVLNLIVQQTYVAGVGNLSTRRSAIRSRCWSAP